MLGLNGSSAGRKVSGKSPGLNPAEALKLYDYRRREVRRMRGVAVKCLGIAQNSVC